MGYKPIHPYRALEAVNLPESWSPETILAQLKRIVSSALFVKKRQLCRFLSYIVGETLAGKSENLKGDRIAIEVLGKNADFNPQLNPVVRVRATQLRKALQRYYETDGINDPIRIDVPKGGYVPTFREHDGPLTLHPYRVLEAANLPVSLSPETILAQLKRIVSSALFVKKRQLCRFLSYIVEETLAGKSENLIGYTIAINVLGKGADFNPQFNPVVRVRATQLRNALHRYYETDGNNDPSRIDVPRGGYVPTFRENENLQSEVDIDSEGAHHGTPTIAVLSMENLTHKPEHAYFATGLTQEFVTALMRFANLVVIGPLLREKLEADGLNIHDVYRKYGVRFLLDGSVQWYNGSLRVKAKLIETDTGFNLWAETYHYDLDTDDWFEIEDDVAGRVVATIADNFGVIPQTLFKESLQRRVENRSIYSAILRYYHAMFFPTPEATSQALNALQQVHQDSPDNATVLAMLADLAGQLFFLGMRDESVLDPAELLVRKAISLDPNHQLAHWVAGWFNFLRFEAELCLKQLEIVLSLNPNHANLVGGSAYLLAMIGDWDRGISLTEKAIRLNPHHPGWYHFVFYLNHYQHGEYEAAYRRALRINSPHFYIDPLSRAAALGQLGRITEAKSALHELMSLMPDFIKIGQKQLRILVFSEDYVGMLWDGLIKGGLA